ncbi:hypothetical protein ACJMK2_027252 [Sinanodonta woodiana]|uniref:G-protein coupled receptors family 2 profile 2 domain-containing protein n=1 Tax=Sinanodonta woodiana TaxID=1069815 RepID=A0ABD3XNQ6_SINWO
MEPIQYASAVCTIISSLLFIFGAIVIFCTYWRVASVRNFPRTLLTWLTIADFLIASGNLSGSIEILSTEGMNNEFCTVQSFLTTFASMTSFSWTLVITIHMMVSVQCRSAVTRSSALKVMYHVICWGVPGIITLLAGLRGALGGNSNSTAEATGSWCWIKNYLSRKNYMDVNYRKGLGNPLLYIVLQHPCFTEIKAGKLNTFPNKRRLSELSPDFRDDDVHYLYLWLVLWLLRIWGTIRFLLLWSIKDDDKYLLIFHSIGDSGQAFGNCVHVVLLRE